MNYSVLLTFNIEDVSPQVRKMFFEELKEIGLCRYFRDRLLPNTTVYGVKDIEKLTITSAQDYVNDEIELIINKISKKVEKKLKKKFSYVFQIGAQSNCTMIGYF